MTDFPYALDLNLVGRYGALPASRMQPSLDRVITVPFEFDIEPNSLGQIKVGVFAHIFYPELTKEIAAHLGNIPVPFDLFVSTDSEAKREDIKRQLKDFGAPNATVTVFPNRGRDIAPFIVGFAEHVRAYDVVCHVHSKQSKHDDILSGWREYLLHQLLGTKMIVSSILFALSSGSVDFLFPDHYGPVVQSLNFGHNFDLMKDLLERCGISFSKDILLEFPSGSMFWARPATLEPLLALGLGFEDFPSESGQIDGTLAHAIERSLVYVTEISGGRWAKVIRHADSAEPDRLIAVVAPADLPVAITRATRRLLGNRLSANLEPRLVPELPAVGFRGESSNRPRFTLLIPTLKPDKIFGGVTSALRLFNQIVEKLPSNVDKRIVSVSDDVDVDCLGVVPDYVRVSLGAEYTEIPRALVDASGILADQLPVRRREVFLATAWWTAHWGFEIHDFQKTLHGSAPPLYYLIQDHEPDFYGWSSRFALAQATYQRGDETVAIINSEELSNYMAQHYDFRKSYHIPYEVNQNLRHSFSVTPKESIILIYARPNTSRNCYSTLANALCLWQQSNPVTARNWRIFAAGEFVEPWLYDHISNLENLGKLSLQEYAKVLCRASIGISLMVSPHPSYPPLEMAEAGAIAITNNYDHKHAEKRSPQIVTLTTLTDLALSKAIERATIDAQAILGKPSIFEKILPIDCTVPIFNASALAIDVIKDTQCY